MSNARLGIQVLVNSPYIQEITKILGFNDEAKARKKLEEGLLHELTVDKLKNLARYIQRVDRVSPRPRVGGKKAELVQCLNSYLLSPASVHLQSVISPMDQPQGPWIQVLNDMLLYQKNQGPFFEHLETITFYKASESIEARDIRFSLNSSIIEKIKKPQYRIHIRAFNLRQRVDDEWDYLLNVNRRSVEVKCHAKQSRTKAFKNNSKYCACLPANVTEYVVPNLNQFTAVWKSKTDRLVLVQLVRSRTDEELVDEVQKRPLLTPPKQRKSTHDVEEVGSIVSLHCPLTCLRINNPVKGETCNHVPCFDLGNILAYARDMAVWTCPICSQPVPFSGLRIDPFLTSVLQDTSEEDSQISLNPNSTWNLCTETEAPKKKRRKLMSKELECVDLLDSPETPSRLSNSSNSPLDLGSAIPSPALGNEAQFLGDPQPSALLPLLNTAQTMDPNQQIIILSDGE